MKHLVIGLVAVCLGIIGLAMWFKTFGMVMRGLIPISLLIFGLVAILSGFRKMSGSVSEEEEQDEAEEDYEEEEEDEELEEDDYDDRRQAVASRRSRR